MTAPTTSPADQSCSLNSRSLGESIVGTAPRTETWLLLEAAEPPGAHALQDSSLPQAVKEYLTAVQASLPSPRFLLIRGKTPAARSGFAFYFASAGEEAPRLYETHLDRYEDLLALDIPAVLRGASMDRVSLKQEPIFVICTNGRRDPCCARWGVAAYHALAGLEGITVWQSSHLGGHRFAANLVVLPYGVYYGHVAPEQASRLVSDAFARRLTLENYRGRACYPPVVQAAEYYLRSRTGDVSLDGFRLASSQETGPDRWKVVFTSTSDRQLYELDLAVGLTGDSIFESCSTPHEMKPVKRFLLSGE